MKKSLPKLQVENTAISQQCPEQQGVKHPTGLQEGDLYK